MPGWSTIAAEVREALDEGRPVVALESTVLAHGLPRPRNLEVGRALEADVRHAGAVPATVAVIDGVPRIGLSPAELERVSTEEGVAKLSTRDLPVAIAGKSTGATTVAATSFLAAANGIQVFATGGIGGVHRGLPLDVSADLTELQRTRILVVCAGAKSILDLPATREALEALGILVLGWQTERFPEFYTPGEDLQVDARVDDAGQVAAIWSAHTSTRAAGGVLLCVPIPEEAALSRRELLDVIEAALGKARRANVQGRAVTPFLLGEVATRTGGASLEANVALLRNNARVAAEVAVRVAGR